MKVPVQNLPLCVDLVICIGAKHDPELLYGGKKLHKRLSPEILQWSGFMTLLLQVSLVGLKARDTKELLTVQTPELSLLLTVVAHRIFATDHFLVDVHLGLEICKEQVVLSGGPGRA